MMRFYQDKENSDESIFCRVGIIMGIRGENLPLMKTKKNSY